MKYEFNVEIKDVQCGAIGFSTTGGVIELKGEATQEEVIAIFDAYIKMLESVLEKLKNV